MKIGMQFAMPTEFHALPGAKESQPFETVSGVPFYNVAPDVIACAGGIGKVNAAMAAEILCLRFGVNMIVNAGVAGCMTGLPQGTLVIPREFVQHDMDTSGIGDPVGLVSTVNRIEFPTWNPERCVELVKNLRAGVAGEILTGRVATGDWFVTKSGSAKEQRARWIRDTFHPLLVDMEGCAVAQVCRRNQIPFTALKSVSDHLFKDNQVEEYFDFPQAMKRLGEILLPFVLELQKEVL